MNIFIATLIISSLIALLGRNRRIGYGWSFALCLFLTPIVGLIIILFSKRKNIEFEDVSEEKGDKPTSRTAKRVTKIIGVILLVLGGISLTSAICLSIQLLSNYEQLAGLGMENMINSSLVTGFGFTTLGLYLVSRVKKSTKEEMAKDEWNNNHNK